MAVVDELAAHGIAEDDGVDNLSILGVLVQAVQSGHLGADTAETIWGQIQGRWDYAPSGRLAEYLAGRPVWRARQ